MILVCNFELQRPRFFRVASVCLGLLFAQAAASEALNYKQCIDKVISGNADLAAAYANVKVTNAQYSGAYSNFFPQLSAAAGFTDSSSQGTVPTPGSLTTVVTIQHQYTESISLNQSLFNGFEDIGKVKQGIANWKAAKDQLEIEKMTLSAALKTNYAQLLYQQKSVDLSAEILKRQRDNLHMILLRFQGGNENKGSLLFQEATVAQAKYQYDHAIRQLKNAVKQLAALWGEPNLRTLTVSGELEWKVPPTEPDFPTIAMNNPNHTNLVDQRISAEAAVQIADGGWYPNLNLIGSLGKVGPNWPPQDGRWSVGISMNFPFFPGTSQIFAAETARAQKMQAEYLVHSTDFKLVAGLENAYDALLDAAAQVDVAQSFQVGAEARSRIANGRYGAGLMTFEDWSVIDTDLVNRQQTLLQSKLNAMQAQASWEAAEGIGDIP
jgi:outer membrane protein